MLIVEPKVSSLIQSLKWRYATKKFDTTKKIKNRDLQLLKEAIQLTATSYGLQVFKVLNITNPAIRKQLQHFSWGQTQIVDAAHLFVFCAYRVITPKIVEDFIALKAETQGISLKRLNGYSHFLKSSIAKKTPEEVIEWNARQIYIALGNLLAICGELQIDACPIEGFEVAKYDEILGLKEKNLTTVVLTSIGYRSIEDSNQYAAKVRRPLDDLFEAI